MKFKILNACLQCWHCKSLCKPAFYCYHTDRNKLFRPHVWMLLAPKHYIAISRENLCCSFHEPHAKEPGFFLCKPSDMPNWRTGSHDKSKGLESNRLLQCSALKSLNPLFHSHLRTAMDWFTQSRIFSFFKDLFIHFLVILSRFEES